MAIVYTDPYQDAYQSAKGEFARTSHQLKFLQRRMKYLASHVAELKRLTKRSKPVAHSSLPNLCRSILRTEAGYALSVLEMKERLAAMGVKVVGVNPLAILNTSLHRISRESGFLKVHDGLCMRVKFEKDKGGR